MPSLGKKTGPFVSNKYATRLSRELVKKVLYDSDEDEEDASRNAEEDDLLPADELDEEDEYTLSDLHNCLQEEADEEQKNIDWAPEYKVERTLRSAIDTSILDRIREGRGPRDSSSPEDLVGLLLSTDPGNAEDDGTSNRDYSKLLLAVQEWNLTVAKCCGQSLTDEEQTEKVNELVQALRERDIVHHFTKRRSGSPYMRTRTEDLERALKTYRPEIASSKPYEIMAILVANDRIAEPEIGFDLRENLIRVMWMEQFLSLEPSLEIKKTLLIDDIAAARQSNDEEAVRRLEKQYKGLRRTILEESAAAVLRDLKCARRNLKGHVLQQLQDLTVSYAGLKAVVVDKIQASPQLMAQLCEKADEQVYKVVQRYDTVEADISTIETSIDVMKDINSMSCSRLMKFSAGDIKDTTARGRIRRERMSQPETAKMMFDVVQDTQTVHQRTRAVRQEYLNRLDMSLQEVHDALKQQYLAYSALLDAVDGETDEDESMPAVGQGRESL